MTDASFAKLVPELKVSDLGASSKFWCELLGFLVGYSRPEDGFAFLDRNGAQVMLHQDDLGSRPGALITGDMQRPFGRALTSISAPMISRRSSKPLPLPSGRYTWVLRSAGAASALLCWAPAKFGYRTPDGYLVRFAQSIGERPIA